MSESTIGIKIANGEYYPVLEEENSQRKRLVLTTVNDNQESVQIDLYKGLGTSIENASYIGSLIIEDIIPGISGEPEIELILGVDEEGNLNATASDRQSGDMQSLSVSLDTVAEPEESYDLPDFELNEDGDSEFDSEFGEEENFLDDVPAPDFTSASEDWNPPESGVSAEEESRLTGAEKKKVNPLLLGAFIIAGLAIIGLLIILLLRIVPGEDTPPLQAGAGQVQDVADEPSDSDEPAVNEVAEPADTPAASVAAETAEPETAASAADTAETGAMETPAAASASPDTGFWYDIQYGDTLWDLSNSFYRTPWLYGHIAGENDIENPDLIYWGTQIYIPKK